MYSGSGLVMAKVMTYSIMQQHRRIRDIFDDSSCIYIVSVKLIKSDYTGYCLRIRRDSDNTTQNIGFDSNGIVDVAAISTFLGAGTGYVDIWYDQSGNGNHAVQATLAYQPSFDASDVSVHFDGNGDQLDSPHSSVYNFTKTSKFSMIVHGNTTERLIFNKYAGGDRDNWYNGYQTTTEASGNMSFILRGNGVTERIFVQSVSKTWKSSNDIVVGSSYNGSIDANELNLYGNGKRQSKIIYTNSLVNSPENTRPLTLGRAAATREPMYASTVGNYKSAIIFNRYLTAYEMAYIYSSLI